MEVKGYTIIREYIPSEVKIQFVMLHCKSQGLSKDQRGQPLELSYIKLKCLSWAEKVSHVSCDLNYIK